MGQGRRAQAHLPVMLYVHRTVRLIRDGGKNGIGKESPGPPPCYALRPQKPYGLLGTEGRMG